MTGAWVVDASVAFSWVHPDQANPLTEKLLQDIEAGTVLVVPGLWFTEVANGLLVLQRRKILKATERRSALEKLGALNFTVDEDASRIAFNVTSDLAEKHGLSVYDATYLEMALRRKLPLATRDAALRQAATRCKLQVL